MLGGTRCIQWRGSVWGGQNQYLVPTSYRGDSAHIAILYLAYIRPCVPNIYLSSRWRAHSHASLCSGRYLSLTKLRLHSRVTSAVNIVRRKCQIYCFVFVIVKKLEVNKKDKLQTQS